MARVVSGFKKQRKTGRSFLTYLALFQRFLKRLLSTNIITLPSFRKRGAKQSVRPQAYLQRDVLRKRLNNPYAKEPKIQRVVSDFFSTNRFRFSFGLFLLFAFLWWHVLFLKPTFYLTTVTVSGTQEIDQQSLVTMAEEHLSARRWLLFSKSHRLFLDLDHLAERIHEQYDLDQLMFEPHWPSKSLAVTIKEKPSMLVYAVDNHYFAVDKNGQVIRELGTTIDPKTLAVPVIYDYDQTVLPEVSKAVLTPAFITSLYTL
jgi:cell division septal protein FtsQ